MSPHRILAINLGSTSSEVGFYQDGVMRSTKLRHDDALVLLPVSQQLPSRLMGIEQWLQNEHIQLKQIDAIVCRGGRLAPVPSGIYLINESLLADSNKTDQGDHASRLSVFIGQTLAHPSECPVYVVDPISVNEFSREAQTTGIKGVYRRSLGHALNSKYIFRKLVKDLNLNDKQCNIIVAHLGGGASISLHQNNQMTDLINDFEGAFTPERAGDLPTTTVIGLLETMPKTMLERLIEGEGGFYSHLGTKQFDVVCQMADDGNETAAHLISAYLYQQKKSIGALIGASNMNISGLAITGGIAFNDIVVQSLTATFGKCFPVRAYPGSFEMEAMVEATIEALQNRRVVLHYPEGIPL